MNKFGIKLRELRLSKGLSQKDITDLTQLPRPVISMYETGARYPSKKNYKLLCRSLEVTEVELSWEYRTKKLLLIRLNKLEKENFKLQQVIIRCPMCQVRKRLDRVDNVTGR